MRASSFCGRALVASTLAFGIGLAMIPVASADDDVPAPPVDGGAQLGNTGDAAAPVQVTAPMSDEATPAAVVACSAFADVLDGSSSYYGDFADSFEGSTYSDPAVESSNVLGRTALRQAAGVAMDAAGTPGLQPEIADPMRSWSMSATALLVKMGLRIPGDSLNNTATSMNNTAEQVQTACAAAGTHA